MSGGVTKSSWVVDYRDGEGQRRLKTFDKQKDAKAWASKTDVSIDQGTHVPDRVTVTVATAGESWLATCRANGLERATIDSYRSHLRYHLIPLIGQTLLSKITVPFVRGFEDRLRAGGRSPEMVKRVVGSLGAIIANAQELGWAAHNPVRDMRSRRNGKERRQEQRHKRKLEIGRDIPTTAEIKAFLGVLEGRWRPFFMTAAFCGLRASELRGLSWSALDLDKRELRIKQRADKYNVIGSPKSQQGWRTLPIPSTLAQVLREWRLICPKGVTGQLDDAGVPIKELHYVFPNGAGNIESHGNIRNRGQVPAMLKAGVSVCATKKGYPTMTELVAKYRGLHAFRHWFASWCINPVSAGGMGLTLKEVQVRMGHASITMTADRYGHLFPRGNIAAEVDAAERALLGSPDLDAT